MWLCGRHCCVLSRCVSLLHLHSALTSLPEVRSPTTARKELVPRNWKNKQQIVLTSRDVMTNPLTSHVVSLADAGAAFFSLPPSLDVSCANRFTTRLICVFVKHTRSAWIFLLQLLPLITCLLFLTFLLISLVISSYFSPIFTFSYVIFSFLLRSQFAFSVAYFLSHLNCWMWSIR